jgi:hypothetical protein
MRIAAFQRCPIFDGTANGHLRTRELVEDVVVFDLA